MYLYGQEVHANAVIEIVWQKEQCNRCNRISGSYYEGLVQVRAQDRKLLPHESLLAQQIATEVENGMQAGGDRLSYISEMEETREGLDITIGSQQIGLAISQAVVQRLGGRYSTHPKLIGEKAGKKLFRITYSVRLPRYIRGDVVRIGRGYGQIMQIEGQYIRYLDLANGQARSAKEDDFNILIGNVRDAADALIAYVDGDILGIIDPGSGVTRECAVGPWRTACSGPAYQGVKRSGHDDTGWIAWLYAYGRCPWQNYHLSGTAIGQIRAANRMCPVKQPMYRSVKGISLPAPLLPATGNRGRG